MAHHAESAQVEIADTLTVLVEEEVVQAPDGCLFTIERVLFGCVAVHATLPKGHLLIDETPHARTPGLTAARCLGHHSATQSGELVRDSQQSTWTPRSEVIERCIYHVHDGAKAPLFAEIRWAEDMGEVVVWMARIQGRNQVCKRSAAGYLAKWTEWAGPRKVH